MPSEQEYGPGHPPGREASAGDGDGKRPATSALLDVQPTILGLARLSRRAGLGHEEEEVYRRIAQLVDTGEGEEFVVAPCGRGLAAQFLAETTGAAGSGVDPDPELVRMATERARTAGLEQRLHFDPGALDDLPYKDDIFDLAVGDVGVAASPDPAAAVAELARVTRPMGCIVLVQPVWNRAVDADRRDVLIEHLGVRPFLLVEWKQMLRQAGVVELFVEDLVDAANPWQALLGGSGILDLPSLRERMGLLHRAWKQWGWSGLFQAMAGGNELRRLINQERLLGLALIKGTKWDGAAAADASSD